MQVCIEQPVFFWGKWGTQAQDAASMQRIGWREKQAVGMDAFPKVGAPEMFKINGRSNLYPTKFHPAPLAERDHPAWPATTENSVAKEIGGGK